jgi:hypothetical protein
MADISPRVRRTPLPDDVVLVVRGDALDPELLTEDAARLSQRYPAWGRTGVSAFHAADQLEVDILCAERLERFAEVVLFSVTALRASGVDIVATFRTPHVTLAAPDAPTLVRRLLATPHQVIANAYHESEHTMKGER